MRWDSPLVLAVAGALAIHTIAIVTFDVAIVYAPHRAPELPPHVELVDIDLPPPPPPKPPPPPSVAKPPEPDKPPEVPPAKVLPQRVASAQPRTTPPPEHPPDPDPPRPTADPGGHEQTYNLPEDTNRDGVGKHGPRTDDRIGPRGTGSGTGSGSGSGSAVEAARPVSVATIKTAARPRGDYAYFDDAKRYPLEAKQLGIEGAIKVQLVVDETGRIKRTRLLTKLGHGLDEMALQHAGQLEFEPARDTDDRAVTSVVVWTFHMTLPK